MSLLKNESILKYLSAIGITEALHERIDTFYQETQRISPYELKDMFVEDYVSDDGSRTYESLTFYSKDIIFAINNFLTDNRIIVTYPKKLLYLSFESKSYDFHSATPDSKLSINISFGEEEFIGSFKASGANCDFLMNIIREYYIQHLGPK